MYIHVPLNRIYFYLLLLVAISIHNGLMYWIFVCIANKWKDLHWFNIFILEWQFRQKVVKYIWPESLHKDILPAFNHKVTRLQFDLYTTKHKYISIAGNFETKYTIWIMLLIQNYLHWSYGILAFSWTESLSAVVLTQWLYKMCSYYYMHKIFL